MKKSNIIIKFVLIVLIIGVIGGFSLIFDKISNLTQETEDLKMNMRIISEDAQFTQLTIPLDKEGEATSTEEEATPIKKDDIVIPTAILFKTRSSPLLSPQTDINVAIQRLVKEKETGIVRIYLRIYTNEAESYSALEPGNLFEIVDPGGQNQKPLNVKGRFDSIPPQSSVTGEIIFKILPDKESVIIQIESKDGANYYEFNFKNKSYKKAVLG